MQRLEAHFKNINKVVTYLKQGGIVIHPTDTCYGLAADITNQKAVERIYALKKMSVEKPMSILVSDMNMLKNYGTLNKDAERIANKYLPGALTLIIPKTKNIPEFYAKNTKFVGIRIPDHCFSMEISKRLGKAITTTSANFTGQMQAYASDEVVNYFGDKDVLFFDGGTLIKKKPSTIVKIINNSFEIIRQGDLVIHNFEEDIT